MISQFALFFLAIFVLVTLALNAGVNAGAAIKPVLWVVCKWLGYSLIALFVAIVVVAALMQLNHL